MLAETKIVIHPYSIVSGGGLLKDLVTHFISGSWTQFRGAIHFAKTSGNYDELREAMALFLNGGGHIDLTFGADVFGGDRPASDLQAVEELLLQFKDVDRFRLFLYHEKGRTFHPKLYLFSNEGANQALVIVGSSNWSKGGFEQNIEANVYVALDLSNHEHQIAFNDLVNHFEQYWMEAT